MTQGSSVGDAVTRSRRPAIQAASIGGRAERRGGLCSPQEVPSPGSVPGGPGLGESRLRALARRVAKMALASLSRRPPALASAARAERCARPPPQGLPHGRREAGRRRPACGQGSAHARRPTTHKVSQGGPTWRPARLGTAASLPTRGGPSDDHWPSERRCQAPVAPSLARAPDGGSLFASPRSKFQPAPFPRRLIGWRLTSICVLFRLCTAVGQSQLS